jgi:hypothetical protein
VNEGVNISPRGQSSSLGAKFNPRGQTSPMGTNHVVKNWPLKRHFNKRKIKKSKQTKEAFSKQKPDILRTHGFEMGAKKFL